MSPLFSIIKSFSHKHIKQAPFFLLGGQLFQNAKFNFRNSIRFLNSPILVRYFCVFSMLLIAERFFMVAVSQFKCSFSYSIVNFWILILNTCSSFCLINCDANLALVIERAFWWYLYAVAAFSLAVCVKRYLLVMWVYSYIQIDSKILGSA